MATPGPELSEKNFINESYSKNPFPFWLWLFLVAALTIVFWGGATWYNEKLGSVLKVSPFLQVTNRELSLFLWENPEFMRINAKQKSGYLPAFKYLDKVTIDLAQVDEYAAAPPELLFRYHTWNRLVSKEFTPRPIPKKDFQDFLSYAEEWQPQYWPGAPKGYTAMVAGLPSSSIDDLSTLSQEALPMAVRMAFQGWQNYFKDGEAINTFKPTYVQVRQFLSGHPHYARNYWRNIVEEHTPSYLKGIKAGKDESIVPNEELSSFLKVSLYNYLAAQKMATPERGAGL